LRPETEACIDIGRFKGGILVQDLLSTLAGAEEFQDSLAVIRSPRIVGLPLQTAGSIVIRLSRGLFGGGLMFLSLG
jgi:hypothetical protein